MPASAYHMFTSWIDDGTVKRTRQDRAATDLAVIGARRGGEHLPAESPHVVELHDPLVVLAPPLLRLPLVVHLAAACIRTIGQVRSNE
jgi:hypothetical protein